MSSDDLQDEKADPIRRIPPVEKIPNTGQLAEKEEGFLSDPTKPIHAEKGWIGVVLGARSEKSGNIAGVLVLIGLIAIIGVYIDQSRPIGKDMVLPEIGLNAKDFIASISSLVTLALGYLFGRNSRSD